MLPNFLSCSDGGVSCHGLVCVEDKMDFVGKFAPTKARADLPFLFPPLKIINKAKRGRFAHGQKRKTLPIVWYNMVV